MDAEEHARAKLTSEQPFDHQCDRMYVHVCTQEREKEDVNKVYTHVHTHICAAGELQRTDSKEWIDERTDEQMARPRTFSLRLSCVFYVH